MRQPSESGFFARIFTAWIDPRQSMRSILDTDPPEGRILMFAMLHGLILFAAYTLEVGVEAARVMSQPGPILEQRASLSAKVAAGFTAFLILRPLLLYALAGLAGSVARWFGGSASWRGNRAAVCWAALISAPVSFALSVPGVLVPLPIDLGFVLSIAGVAVFVLALSYCLAEANGFRRVWMVFLVLGGAAAIVAGALIGGLNAIGDAGALTVTEGAA
ncbi:MAG: YIP1 family protein [Pseudomonadota bacterium]